MAETRRSELSSLFDDMLTQSRKQFDDLYRGGLRRSGEYDQTRDWFYQNVRLMQALTDKGYDVNYTWGIGKHGQKQGGAILPDMMRWLWRDQPVSTDPNDTVERSFNEPPAKRGSGGA